MKTLGLGMACTVVKLEESENGGPSLTEQLEHHIASGTRMLIDVSDVRLTSMRIGELINVYQAYRKHWGERRPQIALMDRTGDNREVLKRARLDQLLPVGGTLDEAYAALL